MWCEPPKVAVGKLIARLIVATVPCTTTELCAPITEHTLLVNVPCEVGAQ